MKAIARVFSDVFSSLGIQPPAWLMPLVIVGIILLLWPLIQKNQITGKARALFRQSLQEEGPDRLALQVQALDLVKENPQGIVGLANEGLLKGDPAFTRLALERLRATGRLGHEVRRLDVALNGEKPRIPEAEVLAVTRFLDEGLREKAKQRLKAALEIWPDHPDLLDLVARLDDSPRPNETSGA
jgi:hypothetical protein